MKSRVDQFQQLKQHMRKQQIRRTQTQKFKTINTIKWKELILASFQKLRICPQYDQLLIGDLKTLVAKISQEKFIEAIINMQPLKPNFVVSTYTKKTQAVSNKALLRQKFNNSFKESQYQSTTVSSMKQSYFEQKSVSKILKDTYDHFTTMIEQETLRKELSSNHHPFTKIMEGLTLLLQNKYKFVVQKMEKEDGCVIMEIFIKKLEADVKMVQHLFKMASKPIVQMFCSEGNNEKSKFQQDFDNFIVNFLRNNDKYCKCLRKILNFASKKSIEILQFLHFSLDSAQIDNFDIPQELKIQGHYRYTTSQIVEFTQAVKGKKCLQKLSSIRSHFYKDLNISQQKGGQSQEINSQIQLEIFKFLLTKLKVFSSEIFAQLKYLELIYGEQQIGFQYQDASYMHSQLLIGFQAIRLKL